MADSESIQATVGQVINRVLTDTGRHSRQFHDDDTLTGMIGLDSLDLAVMVVGLEQALGVDPFRTGAHPVQTFGELVALYEQTLS
jgi:acyl carrier protein